MSSLWLLDPLPPDMEFTMIARSDAACFVVELHKDTLTACVINTVTHEVSYAKIACKSRSRIWEFFSGLPGPGCVAIKTVGFYNWFWDEFERPMCRLHFSPHHETAIPSPKNLS